MNELSCPIDTILCNRTIDSTLAVPKILNDLIVIRYDEIRIFFRHEENSFITLCSTNKTFGPVSNASKHHVSLNTACHHAHTRFFFAKQFHREAYNQCITHICAPSRGLMEVSKEPGTPGVAGRCGILKLTLPTVILVWDEME